MSFDYMTQFWRTYKGKRKFMINKIVAAHEFTGEKSRYTDVMLAKLFNDHVNFLIYGTRSGFTERMNPFFMMIMPDHVADKHHDNIRANQQKLMSHYQIF